MEFQPLTKNRFRVMHKEQSAPPPGLDRYNFPVSFCSSFHSSYQGPFSRRVDNFISVDKSLSSGKNDPS